MASRSKAFLLGMCSGAVAAANWRVIVKQGLKAGIVGGAAVRRTAVRGIENVSDLTHEVIWETNMNGGKAPDGEAPASPGGDGEAGRGASVGTPQNGRSSAKEDVTTPAMQ